MTMQKSVKELVDEASAEIETISPLEAIALVGDRDVVIVDLRDIRERVKEGFIAGSLHAPRGMLEFWVDPASPYYREEFGADRKFVFYCAMGWRSALATKAVQDMGMKRVSHIGTGFTGWVEAGGAVVKTENGKEPKG